MTDKLKELSALRAAADYLAECLEWAEYAEILEQIKLLEEKDSG